MVFVVGELQKKRIDKAFACFKKIVALGISALKKRSITTLLMLSLGPLRGNKMMTISDWIAFELTIHQTCDGSQLLFSHVI